MTTFSDICKEFLDAAFREEQLKKIGQEMKNEDPYNPFSSNYNGEPVGPDSFGGSDYDADDIYYYGKCIDTDKIRDHVEWVETDKIKPKENIVSKENMDRAWIQTVSGKKFYPLNPNIDDIDIEDCAHALSMLCRYTGHSSKFYSVAQHSVLVSYVCDKKDAMFGLLHDLSEAYLQDLPSPLKRSGQFEEYKKYEHVLQSMIYRKFCKSELEPASVKEADLILLATECRDLMSPLHKDWVNAKEPLPFTITPVMPEEARKLFMSRFYELQAIRGYSSGSDLVGK